MDLGLAVDAALEGDPQTVRAAIQGITRPDDKYYLYLHSLILALLHVQDAAPSQKVVAFRIARRRLLEAHALYPRALSQRLLRGITLRTALRLGKERQDRAGQFLGIALCIYLLLMPAIKQFGQTGAIGVVCRLV